MLESAWLFVGVAALVWTVLVAAGAAIASAETDGMVTLGGVIGFVLWLIFAFGSLNVEALSNGSVTTFRHPELALAAVAMAIVPGAIALTGPFELVRRAQRGDVDEL